MYLSTVEGIEIAGLSACVPAPRYDNLTYKWIPTREREKFVRVTGIRYRHIAPRNMTASALALQAARRLLDDMNVSPQEIGVLLFVSQSRDYYLPQTAALLHRDLGLAPDAFAADVSLGCSGYVYGLSLISALLEKTSAQYALLLVADISTRTTPYTDKTTFPLFGDAAAATLLKKNPDASPMMFSYGSDGHNYDAIIIRHGMFRHGVSPRSFRMKRVAHGIYRHKLHLELDGARIMHFSITTVADSIKQFLQYSQSEPQHIDYFIFHQANKIIVETLARVLRIPMQKVPVNYNRYGNTSVASIPLCLVTELAEALSNGKKTLLLSGFGVGLSWGNALVKTSSIHVSKLEYL